jgi:hypothetical protein
VLQIMADVILCNLVSTRLLERLLADLVPLAFLKLETFVPTLTNAPPIMAVAIH